MSELFMECVEEELEPWQKQVSEVHSVEEDDDEPIFVGVLSQNQKNSEPNSQLPLTKSVAKETTKSNPQAAPAASQIMLPLNMAGNMVTTSTPSLTTVTPQPVIVNNQGFIVTSPQLVNNSGFITSLGSQYAPGTSFAIVAGGQQQIFQQISAGTVVPGAVHRPQVQQISNNIVTLSHVQSPTVYSTQPNQLQLNRPTTQSIQTFSVPSKVTVSPGLTDTAENGIIRKKCSRCQEEFSTAAALKVHHMTCCTNVETKAPPAVNMSGSKRIMLVSDFYYGQFEGDVNMDVQRTNTTFKCQSCLKILKNNIRFMNHMKHHLELEKQNSESWESHTTCQHCYRQYMTPFQLQCHIESAHSSIESSTNCKICELAFESEQVLLEHMKDNHKPGEMPYVCQVCNYRSSFFSDVETHFRTVHENTKDLLCPFCLRVLKTSHMYMQHYMKHQKKGIHRCGKCRLNFLTYKDKVEHRTHFHKTFRKPKALEGLPPGTKVTIRASISGKMSVPPTYSDRSAVTITPEMQGVSPSLSYPVRLFKSKHNMSGGGRGKMSGKKKDARATKHNLSLRNLRLYREGYICIECNTQVDDFISHFPIISNCGACKYRTSCKIAIGNHMIKFHSTVSKNRYKKTENKKHAASMKFTLVCLNCDLVDASGGDMMTRHISDRPNHVCKVIQEKSDVKAKDPLHLNMVQPTQLLYFGAIPQCNAFPMQREMDVKPAENVECESFAVNESEQNLQEGDQEKSCPVLSSVSTTDVAADVTDEPMGDEPSLMSESACDSESPLILASESV